MLLYLTLQDMLMKEFEHAIDYDLEAALPRLQAWGLVNVNTQVRRGRTRVVGFQCIFAH